MLRLRGEKIAGVEAVETGFCHRDIAALAAGTDVASALALVERSCALAGAANRLPAIQAIEAAAKQTPSPTPQLARALFAETEPLLPRPRYLGLCARPAPLPPL